MPRPTSSNPQGSITLTTTTWVKVLEQNPRRVKVSFSNTSSTDRITLGRGPSGEFGRHHLPTYGVAWDESDVWGYLWLGEWWAYAESGTPVLDYMEESTT